MSLQLDNVLDESADTWLYTGTVPSTSVPCTESQSFGSRYDVGAAVIGGSFLDRASGTASVNHPSDAFLRSEELGERHYIQGTLTIVEWTESRIELDISATQLCADTALQDAPMIDCVPGPDGSFVAEAWDTFDEVGDFNREDESRWVDAVSGEALCTGSHLIGADELAERTQDTGGDL